MQKQTEALQRGHARTVTVVNGAPIEAVVTAVRYDSEHRRPKEMSIEIFRARNRLLKSLLDKTGAPLDRWSISTTAATVDPVTANIETAVLAAIFNACRETGAAPGLDDNVYCGVWGWPGIHPGRVGRSTRGTATAMRWAAENLRGFVSPSDNGLLSRRLPRHRKLSYAEPATPNDVQAITAGTHKLTTHVPTPTDTAIETAEILQRQNLRDVPETVLRTLLEPAVAAIRNCRPLLVTNMGNGGERTAAQKLHQVGRLMHYLLGPMTRETEQSVIETEDLAYGSPSTGYAEPLPRPSRMPHWSTRMESFVRLLNQNGHRASATPGELDRAVHGTLTLGTTPGGRVDHETADLILRDWRDRRNPYQIILTDGRTEQNRAADQPTNHPFENTPCETAVWPSAVKNAGMRAVQTDEVSANDALLKDARADCAERPVAAGF